MNHTLLPLWALRCEGAQNEEEEDDEEVSPIRSSFSVEDLLDEVEKISSVASSGKKVRLFIWDSLCAIAFRMFWWLPKIKMLLRISS